MDKNQIAGAWHQLRGKVKEKWGKLTHDDLKQFEGYAEQLAGKLQEHYGLSLEDAERQANEFRRRILHRN